jgi:hypothetical protein
MRLRARRENPCCNYVAKFRTPLQRPPPSNSLTTALLLPCCFHRNIDVNAATDIRFLHCVDNRETGNCSPSRADVQLLFHLTSARDPRLNFLCLLSAGHKCRHSCECLGSIDSRSSSKAPGIIRAVQRCGWSSGTDISLSTSLMVLAPAAISFFVLRDHSARKTLDTRNI